MLDGEKGTQIYSIGEDGAMYLTHEENGGAVRYTRRKLLEPVNEFAAVIIPKTGKTAIAADDMSVVLAITERPEDLTPEKFKQINLSGMLQGKKMIPSNLLIAALEQGITLFLEMKDEGGRIEQFACVLDSESPDAVKYFPLASNFSSVECSVAGRAVNQYVDGIYTCGEYGGTRQLLYTPSFNIFGDTQPAPLLLKNDYRVETICTLPLKDKAGTHLFAVGSQGLYFYHYDRQLDLYHTDDPNPVLEVESELFHDASKAAAVVFDDRLYLYVLNESHILSYTYADYKEDVPSDFREPVRLREDVYYFDVSPGGTINICTKDTAVFGRRDPETGNWGFHEACIQTELDEYRTATSYVTKIMADMSGKELVIDVKDGKKASCYVNGVFHNFIRLTVKTDGTGSVDIVQDASDLNPACFVATDGVQKLEIDPAKVARQRVLSLTDVEKIKSEIITSPDGKQSRLLADVEDRNLNVLSSGINSLKGAANSIVPGYTSPAAQFATGVIVKITDEYQ